MLRHGARNLAQHIENILTYLKREALWSATIHCRFQSRELIPGKDKAVMNHRTPNTLTALAKTIEMLDGLLERLNWELDGAKVHILEGIAREIREKIKMLNTCILDWSAEQNELNEAKAEGAGGIRRIQENL